MIGFGLLIGHLIGDYIVQNDWCAANKTNPYPGPRPGHLDGSTNVYVEGEPIAEAEWWFGYAKWKTGNWACLIHCILYTLSIWACSFWWMPIWGLVVCFLLHYPIDRWRLAKWWMINISGQKAFATGILSPWSIIIVDNIFHLLTLFVISVLCNF